jgi:hypothetical protein
MKRVLSIVSVLSAMPVWGAVNVPLTIQEAIYPGSVAGIARTADPVTVGVPLPDNPSTGITDVNQLTLTGASVGQFRVIGRWPSGRIKWVQVDTQADLAAGQKNTSIALTNGGAGNFGGANLATDNGGTITVATGAGTFTIRKANFNVVDQVVVGGKTIVVTGSSKGLVINGPAPGQTTCPPCTTVYSSSNDPNSTAVIEENGPAKTVIKATGRHVDDGGNAYLNFTIRMYFYKGKTSVKVTSILRNADYGAPNTFASAYKGHQGYELRIRANISGAANYSIANHTASPSTGSISGTDSAYIYQAESQLMKTTGWCGYGCVPVTTDSGYSIVKNGSQLISGTATQYPQGWADISDAAGTGIEIGTNQMAAYGLKSLEFNEGGSDIRVGIWARQNSQPYYQSWPQWSIHDHYLNFHSSLPASAAGEFLKFQHPLLARANRDHYNTAGVFFYELLDPAEEDNYYKTIAASAKPSVDPSYTCCVQDRGLTDTYRSPLTVYRYYPWGAGGGGNQMEFHLSYLFNFITRGFTGRYLDAAYFYRMVAEQSFPHSDGFNWRDRTGDTDGSGWPNTDPILNQAKAYRNWIDQEHAHWYGMPDYYFMTGDETIRDAILDGPKDRYMNAQSALNTGRLWNERAVGGQLMATARLANFLNSIGDSDADAVLARGVASYDSQVKPELCASGFPGGCAVDGSKGTSRTRGVNYSYAQTVQQEGCAVTSGVRAVAPFQTSILLQGIWELRQMKGPSWTDYASSLDLAYGISTWALTEGYADDGTGSWKNNGYHYYVALDVPNNCDTYYYRVLANQTVWFPFFIQYAYKGTTQGWLDKFNMALQKTAAAGAADEFGHYTIASVISQVKRPAATSLIDVPVTVANAAGGAYTLSWTVPANAQRYLIKTATKSITDWIGFDPAANRFTGNPASSIPWFSASSVGNPPSPGTAGTTQQFTVTGLPAGQSFAMKAFVGITEGGDTLPPVVYITGPANGATVSGTQTLTANASDNFGVASVQFQLDGVNLGSALTGGGPYTMPWDSKTTPNGVHTLTVVATDAIGNTANNSVSITINNTVAGPVISGVTSGEITSSEATINWTTDKPSDSQVLYGTTQSYGLSSSLVPTPVTAHSIKLTGLAASTNYYYKVSSKDSQGNATTSQELTFTTAGAPSDGGTPLPLKSWTMVPTKGLPIQTVGWEKLVYSPAIKKAVMLGNYHELGSEPNRGLVAYDFESHRWDLLDVGNSFHTENMPEGGHPSGMFTYNPNENVFVYYCCASGSNQAENVNHTWWYDPIGQSGRDKFTAPKPGLPLEATAAFNAASNKLVLHGAGTWTYDPAVNSWQRMTPKKEAQGGATFPSIFDSLAMQSMAYNSVDQKVYMFGGRSGYGPGQVFSNDIYTYDVGTNTWTLLNPTGARPSPRQKAAFAFDSTNNVFLLFGGHNDSGLATSPAAMKDTWIYNPVSNTWTELSPAQSPSPYMGAFEALTYDSDHNAFILALAGQGGYADGKWSGYSTQTWLFRYEGEGSNPGASQPAAAAVTTGMNEAVDTWAKEPSLASSGSNIYAAWAETGKPFDTSNGAWSHIRVSQSAGAAWSKLGSSYQAVNSEFGGYIDSFSPSVSVAGGDPWVSYYQTNNSGETAKIYAKKWNGTAWLGGPIGLVGSRSYQGRSQLIDVAGVPHIVFSEVDKSFYPQKTLVYVKSWDGSKWVLKGAGPLNRSTATTVAESVSIGSDGINPYVAWTEYTSDAASQNQTNPIVYVSRWDGIKWVSVGTAVSDASAWSFDASIAFLDGQPYVAWTERSMSGNAQLVVKTFDGTNWKPVGPASMNKNTATGWAYRPSLVADSSTKSLYLGWVEQQAIGQRPQTYVAQFSGGSWTALGGTLNANGARGSAQRISLAVLGGQPVAAWGEVTYGAMRQVFIKQWNGSAWTSPTTPASPSVPCDLNGDGVVNNVDTLIATNQALGVESCSTADVHQNGQCNVVDVQRVSNASRGAACVTGP